MGAKAAERRRAERTPLRLRGRYLLSDGVELQRRTIDVSVTGVALEGYIVPDVGEYVIVYLDELGHIEGNVARRGDGWFAIDARTSRSRIRRIEEKIAALSGKSPETLTLAAQASPRRSAILRTDFGQEFSVQVSDERPLGATVASNVKLLPGTRVTIDGARGIVGLKGHEGFFVEYARESSPYAPDAILRSRLCASLLGSSFIFCFHRGASPSAAALPCEVEGSSR